ncbi:MAG TPA: RNA polymerase subunit sigma-24 [Pseudobacteroides sp.]|uniref:RNA polymerase subunit sigma-24 n=1 Tax=Pseudobacteroides sp. TaxID=1968840 RepID=UPI002F929AA2
MTQKDLSKIAAIQSEIRVIKNQIGYADIPYAADSVKGSSNVFPYVERSFMVKGYDYEAYYAKLNRLQSKLKRKLDELMDERDKVLEYTNTLDDSLLRQIIILKYINGMTWEQIGGEVGYSARTVRRKHSKFFSKN